MRKIFRQLLFILALVIPVVLVFKSFFYPLPLSWGDAPYFYPEGMRELFSEPLVWTQRGNNLGGINLFLNLSPWMVFYGLLSNYFGFDSGVIIRILFYFPSIIMSFIGPLILGKFLRLGKIAAFFSSFFYVFNTYYLLLVDGGQVGVLLAYGLFPFLIFFLITLLKTPSLKRFYLALVVSFAMAIFDPRFFVIGLITVVIWFCLETIIERSFKQLISLQYLVILAICLIPLNYYWLNPFLKIGGFNLSTEVADLQFTSLLNGLFLFQPHWPENEFGVISSPPFYFVILPLLITVNLLGKKETKTLSLISVYLALVFLLKGTTPPLGGIYYWLIDKLPFGSVFRDSSKFFTPLMLVGGILIGTAISKLHQKLTKIKIIPVLAFFLLCLLVFQGFTGKLNWNLSLRTVSSDLIQVNNKIKLNERLSSFRTLWFYQRPPVYFETALKPALDANQLVDLRPFASLNAGTYDSLNFLYQGNWQDWFDLLGIKYLILSGNYKQKQMKENEAKDWNNLIANLDQTSGLKKLDWGKILVYEMPDIKPLVFGVDKLFVVVGPDDIYEKLEEATPNFSRSNQGFVFVEDGKMDVNLLSKVSSDALVILYNGKDKQDLKMSLLQKYFVSNKSANSNWSSWDTKEFLAWKYQLLVRGIKTQEFDYARGVVFSTEVGEILDYKFTIPASGKYLIALRLMNASAAQGVSIEINGVRENYKSSRDNLFEWFITKPTVLEKGEVELTITNNGGLNIISSVAFIPESDYQKAEGLADQLIQKYQILDIDNEADQEKIVNSFNKLTWKKVEFEKEKILTYKIFLPEKVNWLIYSQSYHPLWKLKNGVGYHEVLPFYSMINGFYVDPTWNNLSITFWGQKYFRWGVLVSVLSVLLLSIIYLSLKKAKDEKTV